MGDINLIDLKTILTAARCSRVAFRDDFLLKKKDDNDMICFGSFFLAMRELGDSRVEERTSSDLPQRSRTFGRRMGGLEKGGPIYPRCTTVFHMENLFRPKDCAWNLISTGRPLDVVAFTAVFHRTPVVERYIPPTSTTEFEELFSSTGRPFLGGRLIELSTKHGTLFFIYLHIGQRPVAPHSRKNILHLSSIGLSAR
jgi:hypothetical protein